MMTRKKSVENAKKSLELEGFVFTSEEKRILEKIANGKLSPADFRAYAASKLLVQEAV